MVYALLCKNILIKGLIVAKVIIRWENIQIFGSCVELSILCLIQDRDRISSSVVKKRKKNPKSNIKIVERVDTLSNTQIHGR